MWAILKFDRKNFHILKGDLKKKIGEDCIFYRPKMLIKKFRNNRIIHKEVDILGDYIFCFHSNFQKRTTINQLKFTRGLKYFLDGFVEFQSNIKEFIEKCKKLENERGFISESLFELKINSEYKFGSGPFADNIFKIINFNKNTINILIGNIKTTINKKEFLFNPL